MTQLHAHRRHYLALLAALFLALTVALPAVAQQNATPPPASSPAATPELDSGPAFVIRPADGEDGDYFTLEADAGTTNDLTVVLGNADDEDLELRTYVSEAVPVANGGFAVAEESTALTGAATWIDFPAETTIFEAGDGVERTFTVTVPDDVAPGQYIAGIVLQTAEPLEVDGSSFFNQIIRKAIAVFIIVPGAESPAFELGEPELVAGPVQDQLEISVNNSGNILVKPHGDLVLRSDTGETVLSAPIAMDSVYAGFNVPLSLGIPADVPEGEYTLSIDLTDEATGITASLQDEPVTIVDVEELVIVFSIAGDVTLAPDAENPAYADVALEITNDGEPVAGAEVVLDVMKDGELVESFALAPNLALPPGTTSVAQRYVPPTGWESGSWSFVVRLNLIDISTGAATTVSTLDTIPPVVVEK